MQVTLEQVIDPLAGGQFDTPDSGSRYVGVVIKMANVGSTPYSDSPSNGATLLSAAGTQASRQILAGGQCQSDFASSAKIASGESQTGCLGFQMATGDSPAKFQFTLSSGFANQTAEWSVSGHTSSSASQAQSSTSAGTSSASTSAGGDPLAALQSYWQAVSSHDFGAAYGLLAPGTVSMSQSQFTSSEQHAGIQSASFSGHITSSGGGSASIAVDSLVTHDSQYGCRDWSGSYDMTDQSGQWLIARSNISPSSCAG